MGRKRKEYIPAEANLAYSGVHESELKELVNWLRSVGAKEISVSDDEGDYSDFEPGPYYRVNYKR